MIPSFCNQTSAITWTVWHHFLFDILHQQNLNSMAVFDKLLRFTEVSVVCKFKQAWKWIQSYTASQVDLFRNQYSQDIWNASSLFYFDMARYVYQYQSISRNQFIFTKSGNIDFEKVNLFSNLKNILQRHQFICTKFHFRQVSTGLSK